MTEARTDLREIIEYIHPADLTYQEWVNVGMALKHEGYSVDVWDAWSRRDPGRYHPRECEAKWRGFHGASSPVTGGTLVQMAMERGWKPAYGGHEMSWDDEIDLQGAVLDASWIEGQEVHEPKKWNPVSEITRYLEILFEAGENVGYVTGSWEKEDDKGKRWLPQKGNWDRTAGQLIEELNNCHGDIGAVLGDYNPEAGAWIRFNPLDGKGCKNENVTEFRYALVESDAMDLDKQNAIIRELELPVACLVFSGKKSLHAIVKVDAPDYGEYRKRVDYLYQICQKNGLKVDTQNKNPSRLSRMPGVIRNGKKQFIVDTNIGKESWEEWKEWIESINDDLPDPESLSDVWGSLPELSPCLIDGVLRQGHKMLISGPSKAGKSFLQIELCISIAEGKKWLKWSCTQGKVLYVNLELDRASCLHRFKDVYETLGWSPDNLKNIDIWNLRGKSAPMDSLAPKLIRRAAKNHYIAIVIDPIYKVITGDENSAEQMARFCNQFDKICTELGAAVIYCHHHSKGSQGGKKSMDRASGSGVFARDPDAMLDLIELETTDALMKQEENKAICEVCMNWLKKYARGLENEVSQDDALSSKAMLDYCREKLPSLDFKALNVNIEEASRSSRRKTAWRVEGILREFPKFDPVNLWFDYPVHRVDDVGSLKDIQLDVDKAASKKTKTPAEKKREKEEKLMLAFEACDLDSDGKVKLTDLAEYMGVSLNTVKNYVDESRKLNRESGMAVKTVKK